MNRIEIQAGGGVHPQPDFEALGRREGWESNPSDRSPYGTTGWLTLKEELETRGLQYPSPGDLL